MFVDDVCGKAEEATDFYISIFNNSKRKSIHRYPANMEPDKGGTVMYTDLQLEGLLFSATDSARNHQFNFNEGISLLINCDDQDEIDYYWKKLSHDRENEACGWLKDKYGVSWQVSPNAMVEMIKNGTKEQIARVTKAFLPMKKLSLQKLIDAYNNK